MSQTDMRTNSTLLFYFFSKRNQQREMYLPQTLHSIKLLFFFPECEKKQIRNRLDLLNVFLKIKLTLDRVAFVEYAVFPLLSELQIFVSS